MKIHPRRSVTALLAAGILAAAMVPAVSAAPPKWSIDVTQQAAFINSGTAQAFDITIQNNGNSNISSLYLIATPTIEGTAFVTDTPVYITSSRAGACDTPHDGQLCNFGALNKGAPAITVTVAYTFPLASGANTIFFGLNTTGLVVGNNNSHGDAAFGAKQTVTLLTASDSNKGGRFTTASGQSVFNSNALSRSNVQATKLTNLLANVAATVEDGSGVTLSCSKQKCPGKQFGEWSDVHVDKGNAQSTPFTITIEVLATSISGNPQESSIFAYHIRDNGFVEVVNQCVAGQALPAAGCLTADIVDGKVILTITTVRNGGYKGAF